ncbi:hypothetical protein NSK_007942 [Nannochloropsis salina CCMP1776]|uniref:Microsomal glutathione S-transferase 1 n=1 Tax=Nannochloropsis salina CCMP1776 TaxID=1027361 RepID=A0A4D9CT20_9STRA|nr:hypothetical protein NSK_007942 [Nannochloropsis salina CCMP1776]|eukprot:TFJ80765.1 hypothetical protein NSK_007942 [Nannochloropsis salina CCMP1776]
MGYDEYGTIYGGSMLLSTLVTCTGLLYLKHVWTLTMQGGAAIKSGNRIDEDYSKLGLNRPLGVSDVDRQQDARWRRIVANDLENIPLGLIVLWSAALASSAKESEGGIGVIVLTIVFTVARFAYTACYVFALQPWRTVAWTLGVLSVVAAVFLGIVVAFIAQFEYK